MLAKWIQLKIIITGESDVFVCSEMFEIWLKSSKNRQLLPRCAQQIRREVVLFCCALPFTPSRTRWDLLLVWQLRFFASYPLTPPHRGHQMLPISQNARQNVLCGEVSSILKIILAGLKSRGSGWRVLHYFPVDILPERSSTAAPPTIKCDKMLRWGRKGGWGVGCTACLTLSNISPSWTWLWRTGVMLSPLQWAELTVVATRSRGHFELSWCWREVSYRIV